MERRVVERNGMTPATLRFPNDRQANSVDIYDPAFATFKAQSIQAVSATGAVSTTLNTYPSNKASISWSPSVSPYRNAPPSFSSKQGDSYPPPPFDAYRLPTFFSILNPRSHQLPEDVFKQLPSGIYDCILRQLKSVHEGPSLRSCYSCYARDLYSLALTSRAWDAQAVKHLWVNWTVDGAEADCSDRYGRISFSEGSSKQQITKLNVRLKHLRRTLRARSFLAQHVREITIFVSHTEGNIPANVTDVVASVVMSCPNLEKLGGFHKLYNHHFDRLIHALSTRRKLKEHLWLIDENHMVAQRALRQLAPGLMDQEMKFQFGSYHNLWTSLTTLLLHAPGGGILERDLFVNVRSNNDPRKLRGPGILHRLPSLRHLCVSSFDMDDFDDQTLQHLPALHSLRLQDLEGVTFWGLSEFSRTRNAFELRRLALVNVDVLYMSAISNLLLRLKNLKKFTLVQDSSPEIPPEEVVIQPIIASPQLEFVHWDILLPGSANVNLADSIRVGAFPRLRTIRAPSDHDGLLQTLCKPRSKILNPSDCSKEARVDEKAPYGLRAARRAAQQRLEKAWTTIQYKVIVEESNIIKEVYDISGFMGTVGSKIEYSLEPDMEGSDHALVDFEDVTCPAFGIVRKACNGSWNASHPAGTKWWAHEERLRQTPVDLMRFF